MIQIKPDVYALSTSDSRQNGRILVISIMADNISFRPLEAQQGWSSWLGSKLFFGDKNAPKTRKSALKVLKGTSTSDPYESFFYTKKILKKIVIFMF